MNIENIDNFSIIQGLKNYLPILVTQNTGVVIKYTCTIQMDTQQVIIEKLPTDTLNQEQFFELESILTSMYYAAYKPSNTLTIGITETDLIKSATITINSVCENPADNQEESITGNFMHAGKQSINETAFDFNTNSELKFLTTKTQKNIYKNCSILLCILHQDISSYIRILMKIGAATAVEIAYIDNPTTDKVYQLYLDWDTINAEFTTPQDFELQLETEGVGITDTIQYKYLPNKIALGNILYLNNTGAWESEPYKSSQNILEEIEKSTAIRAVNYQSTETDSLIFGVNNNTKGKIALGLYYSSANNTFLKDILQSRYVRLLTNATIQPITLQSSKVRTYGYPATAISLDLDYSYNLIKEYILGPPPPTYALRFDGVNDYIQFSQAGYERTQPFTLFAKVKRVGSNFAYFLSNADSVTRKGIYVGFYNNTIVFYLNGNIDYSNSIGISVPYTPTSNFITIQITYSGNSNVSGVTVYINGVSVSFTTTINNLTNSILNNTFTLGSTFNNGLLGGFEDSYFNGIIQEVSIVNYVKNGTELTNDFNANTQSAGSGALLFKVRPIYPTHITTLNPTTPFLAVTGQSCTIFGKTNPMVLGTDLELL